MPDDIPPPASGPTDDEARRVQRRLQELVDEENRRLDHLIQRLHLKLDLGYDEEEELHAHICRTVAGYFTADAAELYLKELDEHRGRNGPSLQRVVRLRGAAGPWERSLRPKYFRRKPSDQTPLPEDPEDPKDPKPLPPNLTALVAQLDIPEVMLTRIAFQRARDERTGKPSPPAKVEGEGHEPDLSAHQVVWEHRSLYSVSRNVAGAPLRRYQAADIDPETNTLVNAERYETGAMKVENRRPPDVEAFAPGADIDRAHLRKLWAIVALRPYVDDLSSSPDPWVPLGNNYSWRRRYAEIPHARELFQSLMDWLGGQRPAEGATDDVHSAATTRVKEALGRFKSEIGLLTNFVVEVETVLAQITGARRLAARSADDSQPGVAHQHLPSFLNLRDFFTHCRVRDKDTRAADACWQDCPLRQTVRGDGFDPRHLVAPVMEEITKLRGSLSSMDHWLSDEAPPVTADALQPAAKLVLEGLLTMAKDVQIAAGSCRSSDPALQSDRDQIAAIYAAMQDRYADEDRCTTLELLGDVSAIAAMYSHTFSPVNDKDRVRLMYVAHHVQQVLDQHLLRDAQQMGVPAGLGDIISLRLSNFHLACLRRLKTAADESLEHMAYEICAEAGRRSHADPQGRQVALVHQDPDALLARSPFVLREFLRCHRDLANGERVVDRPPLLSVRLRSGTNSCQAPEFMGRLTRLISELLSLELTDEDGCVAIHAQTPAVDGLRTDYATPEWLMRLRDDLEKLRDHLREWPRTNWSGELPHVAHGS